MTGGKCATEIIAEDFRILPCMFCTCNIMNMNSSSSVVALHFLLHYFGSSLLIP